MRVNVIGYLIKEGFANILKNKKSTMSSLIIMIATMLVFGIFFLIGENVQYLVQNIEDAQGMEVFILNDATEEEEKKLGEEIRALPYVNQVDYIGKEKALQRMRERLKEQAHVLDIYENNNILTTSYIVTLTDLSKNEEVQAQIMNLENVKRITSSNRTIETLFSLANGLRAGTGIFLAFLIVISIFIISNTIKLAVHSRRKEISIMKYVGATNSFIRWPFIVEGMIIGIMAAFIAIVIIGFAYDMVSAKILENAIATHMNITLLSFSDMFNLIITVYVALGVGVGVLGSTISMKKYLRV